MPIDLRTQKLAKLIANHHSFNIKKNENVIISGGTEAQDFIIALYKEVLLKGAHPITKVSLPNLTPFFYKYANKEQLEKFPTHYFNQIKDTQKYIGINTTPNTKELTSCDPKKITTRQKITHKISEYVCNEKDKIRRCTVAFPCPALAQEAEMSETEYENFVYQALLQDWNKVNKFMKKLKSKFKKNSKVHLIGKNIDLKFKVHGHLAADDSEADNIPGGEVFMAPLRESLNGYVKFEYPAIEAGKEVTDIELKFKDGKVIEFSASKNQDFLEQMLKTDKNSCYIGEFGIGCNPKITKFTKNLLFDEKINATIHLALGMAYKENGGGNDSSIHWDIVKDMRQAKIIVDNKIIQENGRWKI